MFGCLRVWQVGKQSAVMGTDDIFVEQAEQGSAELAVAISFEMFQRESASDDLTPGIGFSFGLFVAGLEGF